MASSIVRFLIFRFETDGEQRAEAGEKDGCSEGTSFDPLLDGDATAKDGERLVVVGKAGDASMQCHLDQGGDFVRSMIPQVNSSTVCGFPFA